MEGQLEKYIIALYKNIPIGVYEGLLAVFCIGAICAILYGGWKKGWKMVAGLLLVEYVGLIFCSTVICRKVVESVGHNFYPFWSYGAISKGKEDLIGQIVMNVVIFIPVGILLGIVTHRVQTGFRLGLHRVLQIVVIGIAISGTIEVLQYCLKRGFSEMDDVIHNTLGCLIGFMIVAIMKRVLNYTHLCLYRNGGRCS